MIPLDGRHRTDSNSVRHIWFESCSCLLFYAMQVLSTWSFVGMLVVRVFGVLLAYSRRESVFEAHVVRAFCLINARGVSLLCCFVWHACGTSFSFARCVRCEPFGWIVYCLMSVISCWYESLELWCESCFICDALFGMLVVLAFVCSMLTLRVSFYFWGNIVLFGILFLMKSVISLTVVTNVKSSRRVGLRWCSHFSLDYFLLWFCWRCVECHSGIGMIFLGYLV